MYVLTFADVYSIFESIEISASFSIDNAYQLWRKSVAFRKCERQQRATGARGAWESAGTFPEQICFRGKFGRV